MKFAATLAFALTIAGGAAAAPAAPSAPAPPPQPTTHAAQLTDADLQVMQFMISRIGERCGVSDDASQFCQAALLGRDLARRMSLQLQVEKAASPPPQPPAERTK